MDARQAREALASAVAQAIDDSGKKQSQIAREIDIDPASLSRYRGGETLLPSTVAAAFALAVGGEPERFVRLATEADAAARRARRAGTSRDVLREIEDLRSEVAELQRWRKHHEACHKEHTSP
ncbi:MAG: hypothetical protein ACYDHP_00740 [Ferrimicrobium sp.]